MSSFHQEPALREAIAAAYRISEAECLESLKDSVVLSSAQLSQIHDQARQLVVSVRKRRLGKGGLDAFLFEYDLSSEEGIALMCLAEALLRIPDSETIDRLIRDKITAADWEQHLGKSESMFVNAATWALMLTGKVVQVESENASRLTSTLKRMVSRTGEPIIRQAIAQAMKILGRQFVMGHDIDDAIKRAVPIEKKGFRYSYDMLGEAAKTDKDALAYFESYKKAIDKIGQAAAGTGPYQGPGVSVKLSALHPRYEQNQPEKVQHILYPRLKQLALLAKRWNIGFTIDAEESDRLELSLDLLKNLMSEPDLNGWQGLGLAVQAYQKRAIKVLDWLAFMARQTGRRLMVRLVKGAYWDSEIKWAQERGMSDYPVFTRKVATDVSYAACVRHMFSNTDAFYPQFATHNAYSVALILTLAGAYQDFEFQCLHGMGDALYDNVVGPEHLNKPCRIYAPVGGHESLLAYLVRRLLENGANTSFVNRIIDERAPIDDIIADPVAKWFALPEKRHPNIPLPKDLYGPDRPNSMGVDINNPAETGPLLTEIRALKRETFISAPTVGVAPGATLMEIKNPANHSEIIGTVTLGTAEQVDKALSEAVKAANTWTQEPAVARADCLRRAALLLEQHKAELFYLLMHEGGKTLSDAVSEVREAVDFCYYYAQQAIKHFSPIALPGPTGEYNELTLHGRGVIVCISPWNFPLAIFIGQVVAALAAGNAVISKPATQTPLIAAKAIALLHEAGVPRFAAQLLPGSGSIIGNKLVNDYRVQGVMFTGSTETARGINKQLASRTGPIVPFIAETGGQNAMLVDSSALPEQVVSDVIQSAFTSCGQRCSALRVLFIQQDIADKVIEMLKGAMAELKVGDPIDLSTDIGPAIDRNACLGLESHLEYLSTQAKKVSQVDLPKNLPKGSYFAPVAYELDSMDILKEEVFGPILHIVRFKASQLDNVIETINQTGYGLTLGVHSRIDETIAYIRSKVKVGNFYVNRNMIGAVVGVQPFGGEGLSGTGPKAGGPNYLPRLATERTFTMNISAAGGNTALLSLSE
ncbi:MAG: bifunctional protein PutA [Pseudomonadota bacterium]|jgi:RHH-type proline utilization regulon transcriptional repressor/proline dehydrogenase/delta 1-pyrroline-5-carboxylate dehydrogenase